MGELEKLEGVLKESLFNSTKELLEAYAYCKCDFLCISFKAWEKLFARIVWNLHKKSVSSNLFTAELVARVNNAVGNFIKQRLYEDKTYLLDNLLDKLEKSGYKEERLLAMFLLELKCFNVEFTKYFFDLLKRNSKKFNSIIRMSGLKGLSYEEFVSALNENHKLAIKMIKDSDIDYNRLICKYSNMSFEQIRDLFGDDFCTLSFNSRKLLERYFAGPVSNNWLIPYKAEKYINFLIYRYQRKDISVNINSLKKAYLDNKDKFNEEQSLFLECFVFGMQDKSVFYRQYPNEYSHKSYLINRLEMLYYGIQDIFEYTLSKEQYLEVLEKYPEETCNFRRDILDDYYGVNCTRLSIAEISKKYGVTDDEVRYLIKLSRNYCLTLYSNLNHSQKIDKTIYMPYVLDDKYPLNSETREALLMFMNGEDYEDIARKINKKDVSTIISKGIQKIDGYRFGIERPKSNVKEDITLTHEELRDLSIAEINMHPSESVISEEDKTFLSFYFGIKNKYNLDGEILAGKKLQERLDFKRDVSARFKDITKKLKQRKMGILMPELISIDRQKLSSILADPHLPITKEDREIICSLLEINGYSLKSISELAEIYHLTNKSLKRKYQIALININKYLIGEKEGIISYECDIVPNLKYFTLKEREIISDYYVSGLTNKQIAKKYNLSESQAVRLIYKIKTMLYDLINNANVIRFDYDYYNQVVDRPDFPYRGDLDLAKRVFSLYIGENSLVRLDAKEIKQKLGLSMSSRAIASMIDRLVLAVFKYKEGIRKENSFSLREIKDFYRNNSNNLSSDEIALFKDFFDKYLNSGCKISEDLIYLMLKDKFSDHFDISKASKEDILKLLRQYSGCYPKMLKNTLMFYGNILERELMRGREINHVFRLLASLDKKLSVENANSRARKVS